MIIHTRCYVFFSWSSVNGFHIISKLITERYRNIFLRRSRETESHTNARFEIENEVIFFFARSRVYLLTVTILNLRMKANAHNSLKQQGCDNLPLSLRTMQTIDLQCFLLPKYTAASLLKDSLSIHSLIGEIGIKEQQNETFF